MKRLLILFTLISAIYPLFSQITIGTTTKPVEGALLQLKMDDGTSENSKKGLGLPRCQITPTGIETTNVLTASHTGMLVYNVVEDHENGYCLGTYVWNGTEWGKLGEPCSIYYKIGDYYPDPRDKNTAVGLVFQLDNPVNGYSNHGKVVGLRYFSYPELTDWITSNILVTPSGAGDYIPELVDVANADPLGNWTDGSIMAKKAYELIAAGDTRFTSGNIFRMLYEQMNSSNVDGPWYIPSIRELTYLWYGANNIEPPTDPDDILPLDTQYITLPAADMPVLQAFVDKAIATGRADANFMARNVDGTSLYVNTLGFIPQYLTYGNLGTYNLYNFGSTTAMNMLPIRKF